MVTVKTALPLESVTWYADVFVVRSVNVTVTPDTGWLSVVFINLAVNVTVPPVLGRLVVLALRVREYEYVTAPTESVILLLYIVVIFYYLH
jgi:hypothetical protein